MSKLVENLITSAQFAVLCAKTPDGPDVFTALHDAANDLLAVQTARDAAAVRFFDERTNAARTDLLARQNDLLRARAIYNATAAAIDKIQKDAAVNAPAAQAFAPTTPSADEALSYVTRRDRALVELGLTP